MTDAAAIHDRFRERGFIVNEEFATALQIMLALEKPLLIEGPAGVGKTESAKVLAEVLGTELIRLQCYEGLDAMAALYEWNYPRQMLHARLSEKEGSSLEEREAYMFSDRFLLKRPLLEAITRDRSPVLLIDEVDRADEAFEAFLLEVLAEWQVTIPELGTIRARHKPHVILTSNRTRELSDALRRRCLFLWLPYPSLAQEIEILHARVPGLSDRARAADRADHADAARAAPAEGARRGGESRLGAGVDEPAPRAPRRRHAGADAGMRPEGARGSGVMHAHQAALDPILGDVSADPGARSVQPRYRLRVRLRIGAAPLMYPFATLPENLAAFCDALRRQHGFHIGARRAAATPLVRSTSWISPTRAPSAMRFGPSSPARWTTSRPSTRRSRSSSFRAPPLLPRIRCPPRAGNRGPAPTAARPRPRARARRPHRTPTPVKGSSRVAARSPRSSRPTPGPKRPRLSFDRATVRSRLTRPPHSSCRALTARGAKRRDRSFAGCTSACRAAGGRRSGDDDSTSDARCGQACRPAATRGRRGGSAALGGRRESCCSSTAAAR